MPHPRGVSPASADFRPDRQDYLVDQLPRLALWYAISEIAATNFETRARITRRTMHFHCETSLIPRPLIVKGLAKLSAGVDMTTGWIFNSNLLLPPGERRRLIHNANASEIEFNGTPRGGRRTTPKRICFSSKIIKPRSNLVSRFAFAVAFIALRFSFRVRDAVSEAGAG